MAKPVVLIVEDDALVLMTAASAFSEMGFAVVEVETADAALTVLEESADEVSVIFSDIQLPGVLDGLALASVVQKFWPTIPVVLTSGQVKPSEIAATTHAHFIPKPYALEQVTPLVAQLATRRAGAGPS